jgi:glucosamine--fructose-6-phosphate aminotransferase (isomerizing)
MIAMKLGIERGTLPQAEFSELLSELQAIPEKIEKILQYDNRLQDIAQQYKNASNALYLGRGYFYPVAAEGALKLKEISYIHAEGYPAAEMKHGPIALIDALMPVFIIAARDKSYEKIVSNIQEVKARKGIVIAIVTEGDTTITQMADHCFEIPNTHPALATLLAAIPLQLLSYHIAVMRGCNVDQPRNLAKSVTVE